MQIHKKRQSNIGRKRQGRKRGERPFIRKEGWWWWQTLLKPWIFHSFHMKEVWTDWRSTYAALPRKWTRWSVRNAMNQHIWNVACVTSQFVPRMTYHHQTFWGLACSDVYLHNMNTCDWIPPTRQMVNQNEDKVLVLRAEVMESGVVQVWMSREKKYWSGLIDMFSEINIKMSR